MTQDPETATPARYPIQLEDVFCASVRAERRPPVDDDPEPGEPGSSVELSFTGLDEELTRFRCRVDVSLLVRVLDDEVADLSVTVQGNYVSESPLDEELHGEFVQFTPMIQLWPYARGYISDLGRLLGLNLPPLPLVDVTRPDYPSVDGEETGAVPGQSDD